jgi:hypothetical protein
MVGLSRSGAHDSDRHATLALPRPGKHESQDLTRVYIKREGPEPYAIRSFKCSPTRMALAMAVSAGFTAPMLGKKLVSTT